MKAVLQFKDYHVLEAVYKSNPFFSQEDEDITPRFFFNLDIKKDTLNRAVITLGIELGDCSLKKTSYYAKAKIMGYFEIIIKDKELAEQKIINYYKVNGVAILFPYLRSLISDMTSKGSETPFIIFIKLILCYRFGLHSGFERKPVFPII